MLKNYKELQIDQNAIRCEVVEFLKQEGCTMKTFSKKVGLAYTTVLKFLKHDINIHIYSTSNELIQTTIRPVSQLPQGYQHHPPCTEIKA